MAQHSSGLPAKTTVYLAIFVILAGLIVLTIALSFMKLGPLASYLSLLIAATQASLLGYYFMHLKGSSGLTWVIVGSAIFGIVILFLFILTDYLTRHIAAY